MSIGDGFNLWLGKVLVDLAIAGVVLAVCGVVYFAVWLATRNRK